MNKNRLLVVEGDSLITEQRRIEKEVARCHLYMSTLATELVQMVTGGEWESAGGIAHRIEKGTDYIQLLNYRLDDVRDINSTFERIQVQVDRIEAQLQEKDNVSADEEEQRVDTDR